ncbi:hypothetical protein Agub_g8041 [Astrephomene gubernaculifera]|uniref:Uncharacterized protein n=1 Tax=Astrephomene gubernaculifera TaxID=47775 RepID=A0AAD3DR19_9CHLO|nr:hypothetical protein Agub_g8041 [Astrephomene gubernaculifera]
MTGAQAPNCPKMRSVSPQPRTVLPQPHIPCHSTTSVTPRCCCGMRKGQLGAQDDGDSQALEERYNAVFSENQLLGSLLQNMQAKLSQSRAEVQRLTKSLQERESLLSELPSQHNKMQILQRDCEALQQANSSLIEQHDSAQAQKAQLEGVVLDLNLRLQEKDDESRQLQERCGKLSRDLQRLQAKTVTAEQVSNQLERVEAMYRSRVEAIKEECREKLATQEAAARARFTDAQAAASQALARVKAAAVREVQRTEALLESKAQDQLRVLEQLSKRCQALEARTVDMRPLAAAAVEARQRAVQLERRLREAEEAAAESARRLAEATSAGHGCCGGCGSCCCCCCCCCCCNGRWNAALELDTALDLQQRLADLRSELAAQVETATQLHLDTAAAQQARVLAEERLEAVEATCRALRSENMALRTQLLANVAAQAQAHLEYGCNAADDIAASCEREAAAHSAALSAAQADAAARELLESARREQVATSRALLGQLRRMQALEAMRLSDIQELQKLERQLLSLRKELNQPEQ